MDFFVLSFEDENSWESHNRYYLPAVKIKDYNLAIDGRNFFDQPVKKGLRAYDNSQKNSMGQGNDYTSVCLLDYLYFKKCHKLIAIDLI